jgi:hypothetical protein
MYFRSVVSKLVLVGAAATAQGAGTAPSGERARLLTQPNLESRVAAWAMRQCPMPVHQPNLAGMKWLKVELDTVGVISMPTVRPGCYNPLGPAKSLDRPTAQLRQLDVER